MNVRQTAHGLRCDPDAAGHGYDRGSILKSGRADHLVHRSQRRGHGGQQSAQRSHRHTGFYQTGELDLAQGLQGGGKHLDGPAQRHQLYRRRKDHLVVHGLLAHHQRRGKLTHRQHHGNNGHGHNGQRCGICCNVAFLHDLHDPGKPLGNGANGNAQSGQRRSSAPQGRRVQGAGFQAVECFREPLGGRLQQLCRDRQQRHEAKDRNGDLRELFRVDPAHHVHGPGQDQDRGRHAGQSLGALVLLPGLDRAGQLLEGAGDGVEHSGQRGLQHCFQALGGFCHLPDAERQQAHIDQAHKPINVGPADGIKALFHRSEELLHRRKGIPHRAVDLAHAALESGSKLAHGFAQVLRHVDEVLLEVLQVRLGQP